MNVRELRRAPQLTAEVAAYPDNSRNDDVIMVRLVAQKWTPDQDPRI
jgi:hypothetical protein